MRVLAVGAVCVAVAALLALVVVAGTGRAAEDHERASATSRPGSTATPGRAEGAHPRARPRRVAGDDRVATSIRLAARTLDGAEDPATADHPTTVVVARHDAFPDALSASALAGELGAPVVVTPGDRLDNRVAELLAEHDVERALLVGGEAALSEAVAADLADVVDGVSRRAGANRFATAAATAATLDAAEVGGERVVLLASGAAFADALALGPPAAASGAPILLTAGERVPEATRAALAELAPDRVIVAGGTEAVSAQVEEWLRQRGLRVTRLGGADRVATAAAVAGVAGRFGLDASTVYVARSDAFADALAAAPAAGAHGAPLVLAAGPDLLGSAAREALIDACRQRRIPVGVGGSAALSDRALHTAAVALARCGRPATTYTYDVVVRGEVVTDPHAFAERAATILADERGWALDGELGFAEVADGGDVTLVLASPDAVAAAHPTCGRRFSCRVGDEVLINDRAWREATPAFRRAGGDLATYRRYVLQHELGHWLGYGHRECPRAGAAAPLMQQQSISLDGCTPQGWPLADERATARDDHVR